MSEIDPQEFGRLVGAVERLAVQVEHMAGEIDKITNDMSRGKGDIVGLLIAAAGVGAGATHLGEDVQVNADSTLTWTEALFLGVFFFLYFVVPALLAWVSYSERPMCKNVDIRALWMGNDRPDKLAVIILGRGGCTPAQ